MGVSSEQPADPLQERVRAGLGWPSWSSWSEGADMADPAPRLSTPADTTHAITHADRKAAVEQRRSRARTTAAGGPWIELFDDTVSMRLETEMADGAELGPLADQVFAIKNLVAVEARVTSAGSPVRSDASAEPASAPVVRHLESLGAIALGSVTLHEFAFGVTGINDFAGSAPNPAAPGRVPGGSSSGSASAVADGSADFAIGTDTGGSVRIPSAFCGIAGFKPAHGTYPATGVFPLSVTLDHVGLHARTVGVLDSIHRLLLGLVNIGDVPGSGPTAGSGGSGDNADPGSSDMRIGDRPIRIGVARSDLEGADPEVRAATQAALDRLSAQGAKVVEVAWPDPEATFVASTAIMFSEAAAIHADSLSAHPDRYGADIRARLELGAALSGIEVASAHRLRREIIEQVLRTLHGVDVIASPTVPIVAPLIEDAADPSLAPRIVANTRLANVVGLPALSLPIATEGPPVGLQLLGSSNERVLAAGVWAERIVGQNTHGPH